MLPLTSLMCHTSTASTDLSPYYGLAMAPSQKRDKTNNNHSKGPYDRPQNRKKSRTPHVDKKFKPKIPGHHYPNNYMRSSICDQYIRQSLHQITPEVIDYDIAVAYFLEETDHLPIGCIPQSVDKILFDLNNLRSVTGRQDDLRVCALHIKSTIDSYNLNPGHQKPFALRYPTLKALKILISERSKSLRALPSDKAVVLVDLAGQLLVMNLPPHSAKNSNQNNCTSPENSDSDTMSGYDRALNAFEGAAQVHALPVFDDAMREDLPSSDSIHPRLSRAKNKPVQCPGAVYGFIPYESFGYILGSKLNRPDTKMQLGMERQGYTTDDIGEGPKSDQHLPQISGLGEGCVFQRIENGRIRPELLWPQEISRVLNAAVNPETYAAAERVTTFLEKNSGPLLVERIKGQQISYNMQVGTHRDGKNSNLLDSVFFYGQNYTGGRFLFGSLGVSLCADPGYSIHARFKLLDHGVSHILQGPDIKLPPLRISLALYAHAETYAGPARVSAARRGISKAQFSDSLLWLPFPPPNFSITTCRTLLRKEEESWKKKRREEAVGKIL
ncbi:uncharacterized protein MELLADRAFT_102585 [Melampsora larici-populina 98AG31]|uniref:Uncharacterized protein n=1 Tax=Melampsora larici-populina (strain 98AG31 / pathotype 3-4-7) TaxID=747676 RepID=F4R794_MELLP|nr:uncharacterized protein MELLADRAFT_102585 [Melampsora larici-populina 98AG31]EGG11559.1 hypothetical protein MELLADRAFT_102585 [Melampsora larici-populina 98AG31]